MSSVICRECGRIKPAYASRHRRHLGNLMLNECCCDGPPGGGPPKADSCCGVNMTSGTPAGGNCCIGNHSKLTFRYNVSYCPFEGVTSCANVEVQGCDATDTVVINGGSAFNLSFNRCPGAGGSAFFLSDNLVSLIIRTDNTGATCPGTFAFNDDVWLWIVVTTATHIPSTLIGGWYWNSSSKTIAREDVNPPGAVATDWFGITEPTNDCNHGAQTPSTCCPDVDVTQDNCISTCPCGPGPNPYDLKETSSVKLKLEDNNCCLCENAPNPCEPTVDARTGDCEGATTNTFQCGASEILCP